MGLTSKLTNQCKTLGKRLHSKVRFFAPSKNRIHTNVVGLSGSHLDEVNYIQMALGGLFSLEKLHHCFLVQMPKCSPARINKDL